MRAARAVIVGEGRIDEQSLEGKIAGEIAVRARQAGVACSAIVGRDELGPFGARMLDLQRVLEATTLEEIEAAAASLAPIL
jgi:glycerate 2-kinase